MFAFYEKTKSNKANSHSFSVKRAQQYPNKRMENKRSLFFGLIMYMAMAWTVLNETIHVNS